MRACVDPCDLYCTCGWNDLLINFDRGKLETYLRNQQIGHNSINMDLLIHKAKELFDYSYVIMQNAKVADHFCYLMNHDDQHAFTTIDVLEAEPFSEDRGFDLEGLKRDYGHRDFVRIIDIIKHLPHKKFTLNKSNDLSIYSFPDNSQLIANEHRKYAYREFFRINAEEYLNNKANYLKQRETDQNTAKDDMLAVRETLFNLLNSTTMESMVDCIRYCPNEVKILSEEIEDHLSESGIYLVSPEQRLTFNQVINSYQ